MYFLEAGVERQVKRGGLSFGEGATETTGGAYRQAYRKVLQKCPLKRFQSFGGINIRPKAQRGLRTQNRQ